jgi:hypothetical protein
MNGNLWVWEQARPKIPSLPSPRRELVREWGPRYGPCLNWPQKKDTSWGGLVRGCSPWHFGFSLSSFLEPFPSFHVVFPGSSQGKISERRNCRSDEPSSISDKLQMGEFSQTTLYLGRSGQSSLSASGCWGSAPLALNPRSGSHRDAQRHGQLLQSGENHSVCASISDPHRFLFFFCAVGFSGTPVSALIIALPKNASRMKSTTTTTNTWMVVSSRPLFRLSEAK